MPKSITQRSHSAEEKVYHDVWSRLYMDKRNALKKTKDVEHRTMKLRTESESSSTPKLPQSSLQLKPPTDYKFSTLDSDRRQRLAANQDVLDRQTDELRKLGIL
ncbi:hypothetical protein DICVIV_04555 [Dictyocaulus viviparus]|uniref:Uncharacterized protein n=1 Tax=Dictyocaulus viviparus TaxID=29172 RepID=A0A0D8Y405_DICVI|nr:hypothetical protein DICVIV_04555 [Dictyocaulus viviparus]